MKVCTKCGETKPIEAFGQKHGKPRGQCKDCVNAAQKVRDDAARERLKGAEPFGTPMQRASAEALAAAGSVDAAAADLKITPEALRAHLDELERQAARRGWSPGADMKKPVPPGFHVKGVSTYYRTEEDGSQTPIGQWVKSAVDPENRLAALADAIQVLREPLEGLAEPSAGPADADADLLAIYPMGDPHFGMLSWAEETGDDFDLKIAAADLFGAVDRLVALAPPAEEALVINLGDFFHTDNSSNVTNRSHHALDVDSRWPKMLRVGVASMRRCIDRALERHKRVRVICAIGNHDDHSAIVLAMCLENFYSREPRVQVDTTPGPLHWHEFGANLIGVHHGHTIKPDKLPLVMATDQAEAWGRTKYRQFYCGHVHHDQTKEHPGCVVETFRTLAARDAWHNAAGYRAGRDMKLDVWHRTRGKIVRHVVGLADLRGAP